MYQEFWLGGFYLFFFFFGTVICAHGSYFVQFWERRVFSISSSLLMFLDSSLSNASGAESLAIQPQKLLILDARSYAAAVANRAKGGGCECPGEVYSALSPNIRSL